MQNFALRTNKPVNLNLLGRRISPIDSQFTVSEDIAIERFNGFVGVFTRCLKPLEASEVCNETSHIRRGPN